MALNMPAICRAWIIFQAFFTIWVFAQNATYLVEYGPALAGAVWFGFLGFVNFHVTQNVSWVSRSIPRIGQLIPETIISTVTTLRKAMSDKTSVIVQTTTDTVEGLISVTSKSITTPVQIVANLISTTSKSAVTTSTRIAEDTISTVPQSVTTTTKMAKGFISNVANTTKATKEGFISNIGNTTKATKEIISEVTTTTKMVTDDLTSSVTTVSEMAEFLSTISTAILAAIMDIFKAFVSLISTMWNSVTISTTATITTITEFVSTASAAIFVAIDNMFEALNHSVSVAYNSATGAIMASIMVIVEFVSTTSKSAMATIMDFFNALVSSVSTTFEFTTAAIMSMFGAFILFMSTIFQSIVTAVVSIISIPSTIVSMGFTSIMTTVPGFFESLFSKMSMASQSIMAAIASFLQWFAFTVSVSIGSVVNVSRNMNSTSTSTAPMPVNITESAAEAIVSSASSDGPWYKEMLPTNISFGNAYLVAPVNILGLYKALLPTPAAIENGEVAPANSSSSLSIKTVPTKIVEEVYEVSLASSSSSSNVLPDSAASGPGASPAGSSSAARVTGVIMPSETTDGSSGGLSSFLSRPIEVLMAASGNAMGAINKISGYLSTLSSMFDPRNLFKPRFTPDVRLFEADDLWSDTKVFENPIPPTGPLDSTSVPQPIDISPMFIDSNYEHFISTSDMSFEVSADSKSLVDNAREFLNRCKRFEYPSIIAPIAKVLIDTYYTVLFNHTLFLQTRPVQIGSEPTIRQAQRDRAGLGSLFGVLLQGLGPPFLLVPLVQTLLEFLLDFGNRYALFLHGRRSRISFNFLSLFVVPPVILALYIYSISFLWGLGCEGALSLFNRVSIYGLGLYTCYALYNFIYSCCKWFINAFTEFQVLEQADSAFDAQDVNTFLLPNWMANLLYSLSRFVFTRLNGIIPVHPAGSAERLLTEGTINGFLSAVPPSWQEIRRRAQRNPFV